MAAAWNGYAADDGAGNLWLCSCGSVRVTLRMPRRRVGGHQRKCKHNGRNNGYDCFHRDTLCIQFWSMPNNPWDKLFDHLVGAGE